jgi:hypothetical protein
VSDDWIREQAKQHRQEEERQRPKAQDEARDAAERMQLIQRQLPPLWNEFGRALQRRAEIYNSAYGRQVIVVDVQPDAVVARAERAGKTSTVTFQIDDTGRDIVGGLDQRTEQSHSQPSVAGPTIHVANGRVSFAWSRDGAEVSADDAANRVMRQFVEHL